MVTSSRLRIGGLLAGAAALGGMAVGHPSAAPAPTASAAPTASGAPAAVAAAGRGAVIGGAAGTGVASEAPLPGGGGFWEAYADGRVSAQGSASFDGDMSAAALDAPVVSIAATADGGGYWLLASDGGVFTFGDARFYGSTGDLHLNRAVVGMAPTADGRGYWLVAADGGIFAFGDARFFGSAGSFHLNRPVVAMTATPSGGGYWLVASDGGVFSFGDARFFGSAGRIHLNRPVVGMARTADGNGYWAVASDGGIFSFGDAPFRGSAVGRLGSGAAVGMVASGPGYYVLTDTGSVVAIATSAMPAPRQPLPAGQDPATSIAPSSRFAGACYQGTSAADCDSAALADIDSARQGEDLGPLQLPPGFEQLSVDAQLVAVANAERTSRGLPAMAQNPSLDDMAALGARSGQDPTGPSGHAWASNISWGYATPLAADFGWMYDDGPGSPNIDCSVAGAAGCWGHRHDILSPWGGEMGAGEYVDNGVIQLTQLFVENY